MSWPFAARAQPRSDSTTVTGSLVDELRLGDRLRRLALDDDGAALVAVLLGELGELGLDELRELGLGFQRLLEVGALGGKLFLLAADLHLLELGEMAQLELEDRLGLRVA